MAGSSFSVDVAPIRERAREKMDQGPVTESCGKRPDEVISVLDDPSTRRLMEKSLQEEEEHADDIVDLLAT
jgi:hypothetical protein